MVTWRSAEGGTKCQEKREKTGCKLSNVTERKKETIKVQQAVHKWKTECTWLTNKVLTALNRIIIITHLPICKANWTGQAIGL